MTLHGTQEQEHGQPAQVAQSQALQPGQGGTPPGKEGTTEIEDGKQYTGAEVRNILAADGRVQKDRADKAEGDVTKLTGELNGMSSQVNTLTTQMSEITKAQNEAEANAIKEDPAALASLRVRQANQSETIRLTGRDSEITARETKLTERETAVATKEVSVTIKLAAMAAGVDEKRLAEFVPDGDPGRLTNAAALLKGTVAPEIDPVTKLPKPAGLTNTPPALQSAGVETRGVAEVMLEKAKAKVK